MDTIEIPPDATVFRVGGETVFLYLGPLEMRALQREWGLTRSAEDTSETWRKKCEELQDRMNSGGTVLATNEQLPVFRHALGRWASAAGRAPFTTDDETAVFLAGIEPQGKQPKRRRSSAVVMGVLFRRFMFECFVDSDEEARLALEEAAADPKGPRGKGLIRKAS